MVDRWWKEGQVYDRWMERGKERKGRKKKERRGERLLCHDLELLGRSHLGYLRSPKPLRGLQAACDVFCVGDDVNIEKANNSLISNDRSWKRNKFRLTYVAEAPELTQGT